MEQKFQTSFIPKKPVNVSEPTQSSGIGLLLLVSLVVFFVSLGLAGYVLLQKNLLISKIKVEKDTIEQNRGGLVSDSLTIENIVELNSRIKVANDLLSKHVAISPIFQFIQDRTLKSVRFKNFAFSSSDKTAGVTVQMSGQAVDWETIASQADEFGKPDWKKIISEPKISNLSLNADGSVSFVFTATISPDYLTYANNLTM